MITDVARMTLFTKIERFFMRSQATPFVLNNNQTTKTYENENSDSSDINQDKEEQNSSQRYLNGLV